MTRFLFSLDDFISNESDDVSQVCKITKTLIGLTF